MPKKKTHDEYIKEVYNVFGDEYTILGEYVNSNTKIKIKHNVCGNEYKQIAGSILTGRKCPYCFGTHKKTTQQFKDELEKLRPNEFDVLGEYVNAHIPILVKHKVCDSKYEIAPHSLLRGSCCRYCSHTYIRTEEDFKNELKTIAGDEYNLISPFVNMGTKVVLRHNVCGSEWSIKPTYFTSCGGRCPKCYVKNIKKTHTQFVNKVKDLTNDEYSVLETYKNMTTKIEMRHNLCGHEYKVRPASFIHSMSRCPKCKSSKGEYEIRRILDKYKINYEVQKWYDGLVSDNNKHLSYDFYLPDYNLLIEYQGQQHEYAVDWFGGKEKFIRQQEFDNQKRNYAKFYKINLLEIWYYDFDNIKTILTKELKLCA